MHCHLFPLLFGRKGAEKDGNDSGESVMGMRGWVDGWTYLDLEFGLLLRRMEQRLLFWLGR